MYRITTVAVAVLLVTASVASAAAVGGANTAMSASADEAAASEAFAGSHVTFETTDSAITNYSVDGNELFASAETGSQADVDAESEAGLSLSQVDDIAGVDLSLDLTTETRAELESESGATIAAHDSERGILTVDVGEEAHYAEFDLAGETEAESDGDERVVVDNGERTGAFVVVGDGEVAVNEDGNVTADLASDSKLVFRSYADDRDEADREQENLIADGTATAEVFVEERDGERVADVATYGQDLAVDVQSESEQRVEMTVDRASSEGTVVVTSVSEGALDAAESAEDVDVTVDGETAASASSYSELEGGIGEEPRYVVQQSGEAAATADVLVAVDHFSEREVAIASADDGSESGSGDGDDGPDEDDELPGFGAVVALLSLLTAAGLRVRA